MTFPRCMTLIAIGLCLLFSKTTFAQRPEGAGSGSSSLPDNPQPKTQDNANPAQETTEKFIGYITNRSIAFPDIATSQGPLTNGEKFKLFVNQSISPAYLLAAGVSAAYGAARDNPEAYGEGWGAYGERYGAALARASSNSFFGTFLLPSLLHQDPRFFPQSHPSFWGSVKYSAKRLVITRTDSGHDTVNYSGLVGTLAAEGLANAYLPVSEQTAGKTFERFATDTGWRFASNMFKDYWPTFFHRFGLQKLVVVPDPGSPDSPASTAPKF